MIASENGEDVDRRNFMLASVAATGAATSLVAGPAQAQTATAPASAPASGKQGTVYAGDVIDGKKVISSLDVNALDARQKHRLYFQGVKAPTGQHWYVSVTVARGRSPASASF